MAEYDNWIWSEIDLFDSPSRRDGITADIERTSRYKTAWFTEEIGKSLNCPRFVVSTALVFFHRFYALQSFKQHNRFILAVTCLFLATKVEEQRISLKNIVAAYATVRNSGVNVIQEAELKELPGKILVAERILMQTLCFDLQVENTYVLLKATLVKLRNYIPNNVRSDFYQSAQNFLNDSYRTTLFLQFKPSHIVLAIFLVTTLHLDLKPININQRSLLEQSWYELIETDIDEETLKSICHQVLDVSDPKTTIQVKQVGEEGVNVRSSDLTRSRLDSIGSGFVQTSPTGVVASLTPTSSSSSFSELSNIDISSSTVDYPYEEEVKRNPIVTVTRTSNHITSNTTTVSNPIKKRISLPPPTPPEESPINSNISSVSIPPTPPPDTPNYIQATNLAPPTPPPPTPPTPITSSLASMKNNNSSLLVSPSLHPLPPPTPNSIPPTPIMEIYSSNNKRSVSSRSDSITIPLPPPTPDSGDFNSNSKRLKN